MTKLNNTYGIKYGKRTLGPIPNGWPPCSKNYIEDHEKGNVAPVLPPIVVEKTPPTKKQTTVNERNSGCESSFSTSPDHSPNELRV